MAAAAFSVGDHPSGGPSGERDQSCASMRAARSPPPDRNESDVSAFNPTPSQQPHFERPCSRYAHPDLLPGQVEPPSSKKAAIRPKDLTRSGCDIDADEGLGTRSTLHEQKDARPSCPARRIHRRLNLRRCSHRLLVDGQDEGAALQALFGRIAVLVDLRDDDASRSRRQVQPTSELRRQGLQLQAEGRRSCCVGLFSGGSCSLSLRAGERAPPRSGAGPRRH